jgi:phage-related minor tail protein
MAYSTQSGAVLRIRPEGAEETQRAVDGVGASMTQLGTVSNSLSQSLSRFSGPAGNATTTMNNTASSLNRVGVSAAQTAAALRNVPAQVTDIVTSLQGGQAPLTVFLQQGGQLRDMFGSAGGAAKALGGYLMGLVNPTTIAAAATLTLALAYHTGSAEAQAYSKAIITSGNAAGVTSSQLTDMARNVSRTVGTQGAASEAIIALVNTGKVAADSLQKYSITALNSQRALGISVTDTAAQFAELAKSPVAALEKLNDQYHFVTSAVFSQVRALEQLGRTTEAGRLAQQTYSTAMDEVSSKVQANLGYLERGWEGIKGVAKGAWDAMLDVGREDSLTEKLTKVQAKIKKAQGTFDASVGGNAEARAQLKDNLLLEVSLQKQIASEEHLAKLQAQKLALDGKFKDWAEDDLKYLDRRTQMVKALDVAEKTGFELGISNEDLQKRLLAIQLQYADVYNDGINSQIEGLKRRSALEDLVSKRSLVMVNASRAAGLLTETAAIEQVAALELAAFAAQKSRLQEELDLTARKQNSLKDQAALRGQIAETDAKSISRQMQLSNDLFGLQSKMEQDVFGQILQSTAARNAANDTLSVEYALYGKSADAREIALVAIRAQAELEKYINDQRRAGKPLTDEVIAQMTREKDKRVEVTQATMEQGKALGYAAQLQQENKKFAAESIFDEQERARQLVAIDAEMWQERIRNAGEGTEAQKKLAEEFGVWYRNQMIKPQLEADRKLWGAIENTAHDTFLSIFDSGKSAFDRLRDTLKNGLLELLWQMTAKKWLLNVGASVSGAGAGSGFAEVAGAANAVTGASNALNLVGIGSSLTTAFNSSVVGQFFSGLSGSASAASAALGGAEMTAAASFGTQISAAFAAIPGWGWAALGAAAIGAWLLNEGPETNTRLRFGSNNAAGNISINERGNEGKSQSYIDGSGTSAFGTFGVVSSFWMNAAQPAVQQFIQTVSKTDDILASFLTATERSAVSKYLTGQTSIAYTGAEGDNPNASGQLDKVFAERIGNILEGVEPGLAALTAGFKGTSQELATEAGALLQYRQALTDSGEAVFGAKVTLQELSALKLPTESTSAALTRVTGVFNATNEAAKLMGETTIEAFGAVGLASFEARERMLDMAGGVQGLATIINTLKTAQEAYAAAVSSAQAAIRTAAAQYHQFVEAVTNGEAELGRARDAIADQYRSAVEAETAAKVAVTDEQKKITAGYISASQKVVEAQRKVVESFSKMSADMKDLLGTFDTTDIAGASNIDQLAASQARLAVLAAQSKAGDANAYEKIPAIVNNILKLGEETSATKTEFARLVAGVRNTIADVAAYADGKVAGATPADDPNVAQLDALTEALEEQKKWYAAVQASGASFTTSTESILAGYSTAVASQVEAASSVAYFASIAKSTGTDIAGTGSTMTKLGNDLLTGFFTAKTQLDLARIDLVAANTIKGNLELRQTSALENFVTAIVNVNTTAQTVLDTAGALFAASSNQLLLGSEASNKAMQEAQAGMTYWGTVVISTANSIANSAAALAAASASAQAVAAANAAAQQAAASAAAAAASQSQQQSINTAFVRGIYEDVLGRQAEASGLAFWVEQLTNGTITNANAAVEIAKGAAAQSENLTGTHAADWTLAAALSDDIKGTAYLKSLGIPGFAVGINSVPNDMLAMVHQGEEITPRPFVDLQRAAREETNTLLGRLVASNAEMRTELAQMRLALDKTEVNTKRGADSTDQISNIQEQVVRGGLSYQTRAAGTEMP